MTWWVKDLRSMHEDPSSITRTQRRGEKRERESGSGMGRGEGESLTLWHVLKSQHWGCRQA